jgi:hypothetical protein
MCLAVPWVSSIGKEDDGKPTSHWLISSGGKDYEIRRVLAEGTLAEQKADVIAIHALAGAAY